MRAIEGVALFSGLTQEERKVLAERHVVLAAARDAADAQAQASRVRSMQGDLLSRIRRFFALG